jgi:hypothetical protein
MRFLKLTLLMTILTLMPSCADWLDKPSEAAKVAAVCEPTKEARAAHAAALIQLGMVPDQRAAAARKTGAVALGGVAAGCNEV